MIKGIDLGNGYTKYGEGKFASKVKFGEITSFGKRKQDVHQVEYNGVKFIIGDGSIFSTEDRYFSDYYKMCLLTAIALNEKEEDFITAKIIVGVPYLKHKLIATTLKDHIMNYGQEEINVDGKRYTIRIEDVGVFVEGAYPILTEDESRMLVIDMGRGTINVTLWDDMSIEAGDTYDDSLNKMYSEIAIHLKANKKGASQIASSDIENLLNKKKAVIGNETVDISEIKYIIENNIQEIASAIKAGFKHQTVEKIYVIGGGGADTYSYWKNHFPKAELVKDYQNINQKVYDKIANEKYGD